MGLKQSEVSKAKGHLSVPFCTLPSCSARIYIQVAGKRHNATFGQVVAHIRQTGGMNEQVIALLESINTLRNRNFGHGMVAPFSLTGPEVDFTYLTCIGVILLLTRVP
jgi:hypothetical protein